MFVYNKFKLTQYYQTRFLIAHEFCAQKKIKFAMLRNKLKDKKIFYTTKHNYTSLNAKRASNLLIPFSRSLLKK